MNTPCIPDMISAIIPESYDMDKDFLPVGLSHYLCVLMLRAPELKVTTLEDGQKKFAGRWKGEHIDDLISFTITNDGCAGLLFIGGETAGKSDWIFED